MLDLALQHVVIAAALAAVASLVCRIGRIGPVARHALWLVVLTQLITPPVIVLKTPWIASATPTAPKSPLPSDPTASAAAPLGPTESRALPLLGPRPSDGPSGTPSGRTRSFAIAHDGSSLTGWLRAVAVLWLSGTLVFVIVEAIRGLRTARAVLAGVRAPDDVLTAVSEVAASMRIRPPAVVVMPDVASPMVWCLNLRRPILIWPAGLSGDPSACVDGLVTHELAHLKRRDHWVGWVELAAGAVWWWNPLFWLVRARVRENAELACDAWVVDAQPDRRRAYAEAVLAACAARPIVAKPVLALGMSTGRRRVLERRLAMIMQKQVPIRLSRAAAVTLTLTALATLPVWAARRTPPAPDRQSIMVAAPPQSPGIMTPRPAAEPSAPAAAELAAVPSSLQDGDYAVAADEQLPDEAAKLIQKFEDEQATARRDVEAKLAVVRDELVKKLQALQDAYTRDAKLDEAVAIRDRIRQLTSGSALAGWIAPGTFHLNVSRVGAAAREMTLNTPAWAKRNGTTLSVLARGNPLQQALIALRGQKDASFVAEVEGTDDPSQTVWGTDVYTDDSSIAAAAVHAGLLKPGEKALLRIIVLPGRDHYDGSDRHGVKSDDYERWEGSFRLERADRR